MRLKQRTLYYRYILIGIIVGICSGIVALIFHSLVEALQTIFMNYLIGINLPKPGESSFNLLSSRFFLLPLCVTIGGLLSGILVYKFAPEAAGHGTDVAISAYHESRRITLRTPLTKMLASSIVIGTGGSAGEEGPSTQIVSGFAYFLLEKLGFNEKERRIAIAVGIGAAIGAIFKVPIGGALLSAEILYKRDMEVEVIYPSLIASSIGYVIFGFFKGYEPLFLTSSFSFNPFTVPFYILEGIAAGILALLYIKTFYGFSSLFDRLKIKPYFKPMIGGICVGTIALVFPQVIGQGYGWIQVLLDGKYNEFSVITIFPILLMLAMFPLLKIIATSFTVGSGGSGGIFAPGMTIGAGVGAFFGYAFHLIAPTLVPDPAPFIVVGMMCFFGSAGKVTLSILPMVVEMTGSLHLLPYAMIATVIATIITGENTIYRSQLPDRKRFSTSNR